MKVIILDLKKLTKSNIGISALVLVIVSMIFVQIGLNKFHEYKKSQLSFTKLESRLIERYVNYRIYGIYGFRMLLCPSPLFALSYKTSPFNSLQGYIDNAARLDFEKPETPETIFNSFTDMDYFLFLCFVETVFCLFLGLYTFRDIEYVRFLKYYLIKNIYLDLFLARLIFVSFCLFIQMILIVVLFAFNGIKININLLTSLMLFFVPFVITCAFCVAIGMLCSKLKKGGMIWALVLWASFSFLIPEFIQIIVNSDASKLNRHIFELNKVSVIMNFEKDVYSIKKRKKAESEEERFKIDKNMTERYYNKDSKEIDKLENINIFNTEKLIKKLHNLSNLSPFTFLKSSASEICSMGYNSYLTFYKNNRKHQKGFFEFYKKNVYDDPYAKVIPYLKDGENLVYSLSTLPAYYILGICINAFYVGVFLFIGFLLKQKIELTPEFDVNLSNDKKYNYFFTRERIVEEMCLKLSYEGKAKLDDVSVSKIYIFYLPNTNDLPIQLKKSWFKFFGLNETYDQNELWRVFYKEAIKSHKKLLIGVNFLERRTKTEINSIVNDIKLQDKIFLEIGKDKTHWRNADNPIFWMGDKSIDINEFNGCFEN